jgi:hypothetical protein
LANNFKSNVMKRLFFLPLTLSAVVAMAQTYPNPEFTNEVYAYQKQNNALTRLEKGSSKMETKTKLGGMGGAENAYSLDNEKSSVRLNNMSQYSFVYWNGAEPSSGSNAKSDSIMRANGIDPNMVSGMAMDPSQSISLYKAEQSKGKRKILLMSMGPFKKNIDSNKCSLSFRKIRNGYYEVVVDKPLPKGEYAFVMMGMGSMDGSVSLFAFAVD